jgi:hypothetical protein
MKQIKNKTYTINMAGIPDKGILLIIDGDTKEYISFEGFEPPVIDKKGKVIKTGKLLNVKRNL